jgi:hypothetical protein
MHSVKVKRTNLLEKITKNRDAHRDLFLKAQEGYRIDVIVELDKMLKDARDGKSIRRTINLVEPQDHTNDYNRVITMLEMSIDDDIDLDARSFDNYVMDNWDWKAFAESTNALYAAKAIRR